MVLTEATAAAAAAGGAAFSYNRENFKYDRNQRQETEYQVMDYRVVQAEQWREDVSDIVGLASVKMDTYLIVNSIALGFCVMAFCEGRLAAGTPIWLIGCHTLSLGGSFIYLLMSTWFAMHASVTAKSYEVRLKTQLVRLPVPTWAQLESARTYSSAFEKADARQMFRVPFAMGQQESALREDVPEKDTSQASFEPMGADLERDASPGTTAEDNLGPGGAYPFAGDATGAQPATVPQTGSADPWGLEGRGDRIYELNGVAHNHLRQMQHLNLVRQARVYWQSYDGFARVSLSVGMNQLLYALAYYVLGYVLISDHAVMAAWLTVLLFMAIAASLIRLDMSLTSFEYRVALLLVVSGPLLSSLAAQQWALQSPRGKLINENLVPFIYIVHSTWLLFLLYISKVGELEGSTFLPTGFRSVMYVDVFGWIKGHPGKPGPPTTLRAATAATTLPVGNVSMQGTSFRRGMDFARLGPVPGQGPAVEAVVYERGQPASFRPEQLPGALPCGSGLPFQKREDLEPVTFVPKEKVAKGPAAENAPLDRLPQPGLLPWRIFCSATAMLVGLWISVGLLSTLDAHGIRIVKVRPLLREEADEAEEGVEELHPLEEQQFLLQLGSELPGGRPVPTMWPHTPTRAHSPHGLACSSGADGKGWVAATSRFGLYAAHLNSPAAQGGVAFEVAPLCEAIEGEAIQDVALECLVGSTCYALVAHRQGQRLAACALEQDIASNLSKVRRSPEPEILAGSWLSDTDTFGGGAQEEVKSIALGRHSKGPVGSDSRYAYMETSGGRLLEVKPGKAAWFPSRLLKGPGQDGMRGAKRGREAARAAASGGALSTTEDSRHLLVLRTSESALQAFDLKNGTGAGQWALPQDQRWSAMCTFGQELLLLAEGKSPQLWSFPLPGALRSDPTRHLAASSSRRLRLRKSRTDDHSGQGQLSPDNGQ